VATEQFRNSNAYLAPSNIAVQPGSGWSGLAIVADHYLGFSLD
jgi:hypothetical protein